MIENLWYAQWNLHYTKKRNKLNRVSDRSIEWERINARFPRPFDYVWFFYSTFVSAMRSMCIQTTARTTTSDICRLFEWIIRIGCCWWIWGFVLVFKTANTHTSNQTVVRKERERNISRCAVLKQIKIACGKNKSPTCLNNAHSIRCYRCPKSFFNCGSVVTVVLLLLHCLIPPNRLKVYFNLFKWYLVDCWLFA